jgi:hypothetical protein
MKLNSIIKLIEKIFGYSVFLRKYFWNHNEIIDIRFLSQYKKYYSMNKHYYISIPLSSFLEN